MTVVNVDAEGGLYSIKNVLLDVLIKQRELQETIDEQEMLEKTEERRKLKNTNAI